MTAKREQELLQRIAELEGRLKALEARTADVNHYHYHTVQPPSLWQQLQSPSWSPHWQPTWNAIGTGMQATA